MKALQLKISLINMDKTIYRILNISKKETFENLHEMIQILFNLDGCESYIFKINQKEIVRDHKNSQLKTLNRMKEKDVFFYDYDLIDMLKFKIEVLDIIDTDILPYCTKTYGRNIYEGIDGRLDSNYQSKVDKKWINESLSYFNEDKKQYFVNEVKKEIIRLTKIRFFQDYMHNQVVKIECPQRRVVFMGCDATQDVVLNYHANSNKLIEYTGINTKACTQSIIKYHDCIECTLIKRSKYDESSDFDFMVGNYGVFLSNANVFANEIIPAMYMNQYLYALRQYVNTIEYCKQNQIKFSYGYMMEITSNNEIKKVVGKMNILEIQFLNEELCKQLVKGYDRKNTSVEIDIITCPIENHLETKVVISDGITYLENEIFNTSIKTMMYEIILLLEERWEKHGIDKTWIFRDNHLVAEFEKIADYLGVEILLQNNLPKIDEKYITSNNMDIEMDPSQIISKIFEDLGIDSSNMKQVELSKEELFKKIQEIKNSKKYS